MDGDGCGEKLDVGGLELMALEVKKVRASSARTMLTLSSLSSFRT